MTEKEKLELLLGEVSRTFAPTIPLLDVPLRWAVMISYLLFRIADTIEDAAHWSKETRLMLLSRLAAVIQHSESPIEFVNLLPNEQWVKNPADLEVLRETPFIIGELNKLSPEHRQIITNHVLRFIEEIKGWVERYDADNQLHLISLWQLTDYCHTAAGIVGEMLTSLFASHSAYIDDEILCHLRSLELDFADSLQLINIIKDYFKDRQEGRFFIPPAFCPEKVGDFYRIIPLVHYTFQRLGAACRYVECLPVEEIGIRRFCLVPIVLATAT